MAPRNHRIHLGRTDPPESSPQNHSSAKPSFSGPQNHSKNIPGPKCRPRGSKIRPRPPKSAPGHEQNMRAEKPCRTPPSKNPTGPYSASYGRKPFWGVPLMSGIWELAGSLGSQGWPSGDLKGKCLCSIVKIYENENRDNFACILEG